MITTRMATAEECTDEELVARSLAGNQNAFGQIVVRYQTLICSLAYSATGSLAQSKDLSQETFLTAWNQLSELREPGKLRSWLCGIVRNLCRRDRRGQEHEPLHAAEPLETVSETPTLEPHPLAQAISREEEAILWRSLERIPETYREPLILFYRDHQSVNAVARDLELSEDAVRQRLSRGRKLLQEQIFAFVAGALKQTSPRNTFALGVLAALPLLPSSAKAATVAATAASGSAAKASAGGGKLGALLMNGMMALVSLLGASGIAGRWLGRKMWRAGEQSSKGQQRVLQFWCTLALGFTVLVLPTMLVPSMKLPHHRLYHAASWSLVAFYGLVAAALAVWMWQRWRDAHCPDTEPPATTELSIKSYRKWVVLGMLGPALILVKFVGGPLTSSTTTMRYSQIPVAEALTIISEHKGGSDAAYFWRQDADARKIVSERNNARFMVNQYSDSSKFIVIRQPASAGPILCTPWDDSLMAALAEKDIAYKTQLAGGAPLKGDVVFRYGGFWNALNDQGSRFLRIFRWGIHHGDLRQWLVLLSTAIVAAASVLCLRRPGSPAVRERHS